MKRRRMFITPLCVVLFFSVILSYYLAHGASGKPISVGEVLPEFTLTAPGSKEAREYLGLQNTEPFSLSQLPAKLILVEIFSTVCSDCLKNAPTMKKLYKVIRDDEILSNDIKVLGIGVGDNEKRVNIWRTKKLLPFPLFADPKRVVHKKFGLPGTPYTVLVNNSGKVLYAHGGQIKDIDKFLGTLREFQKQQ